MTMATYAIVDTTTNLVIAKIEAEAEYDPTEAFGPNAIKVLNDTAEVGWTYTAPDTFTPPPPSVQDQLANVTAAKQLEGITVSGTNYHIEDLYLLSTDYAQVSSALGTDGARVVQLANSALVSLTGAQLMAAYDGLLAFRAALYYARATVQGNIDNETITDWEEVEGAFNSEFEAAPALTITRITDEVSTLVSGMGSMDTAVGSLETAMAALAEVASTGNYGDLSGLPELFVAVEGSTVANAAAGLNTTKPTDLNAGLGALTILTTLISAVNTTNARVNTIAAQLYEVTNAALNNHAGKIDSISGILVSNGLEHS